MIAKIAARIGLIIQAKTIFVKESILVVKFAKKFQPIIAPTIACEVETGSFNFDIQNTAIAAAKATINEPAIALMEPRWFMVSDVPLPLIKAPIITNTPQVNAAVLKRSILEPTAVPNTLAPSLAPSDQPRNKPLERNKNIIL